MGPGLASKEVLLRGWQQVDQVVNVTTSRRCRKSHSYDDTNDDDDDTDNDTDDDDDDTDDDDDDDGDTKKVADNQSSTEKGCSKEKRLLGGKNAGLEGALE